VGKRTKEWLQHLPGSEVGDMLALRREAIMQGPDTAAWRAAEACWNHAKQRVKLAVLKTMFTYDNKVPTTSSTLTNVFKCASALKLSRAPTLGHDM
jgi:hypothetical protein